MANKFKTVPLDTMIDKHIGKRGTVKREMFENELRIELLGQAIAALTFPAFNPPARKTGLLTSLTSRLLISQLCVFPVPPSVLIAALGLPLSSKIKST